MSGRPRSTSIDRAIIAATLRSLATDGYQSLAVERVAATAGVARATVYRRHRDKAALVAAALASLTTDEPAIPPDTRGALVVLLQATARALGERGGMPLVGSILAQEATDPELGRMLRSVVFAPRHALVRGVLLRGVASGEVAADVSLDVAIDLLFGALLARALAGERGPAGRDMIEAIVDAVLLGIAPRDRRPALRQPAVAADAASAVPDREPSQIAIAGSARSAPATSDSAG